MTYFYAILRWIFMIFQREIAMNVEYYHIPALKRIGK